MFTSKSGGILLTGATGFLGTQITRRLLQETDQAYEMQWHEFLPRLLGYAVEAGFLHRSERILHDRSSSVM